jgi:hypothetical protein
MKHNFMKKPIYRFLQMKKLSIAIFISICTFFNTIMAQDTTTNNVPVTIKTEQNRPVKNVNLSVMMDDTTVVAQGKTNTEGVYYLPNLLGQQQYKIIAAKSDEAYVGVTTFDISVLIRHILGIETITSPYALLAGDVDESGEIDGADIAHIRNFILRKTPSLPRHVWRFIDKKYVFINPASPFSELVSESIDLSNISATSKGDFIGIKVGDVSSGLTPQSTLRNGDDEMALLTRDNRVLTLLTDDVTLKAGQEYTIRFKAENFNALAYQFSLGFKPKDAKVLSIEMGELDNMSNDNFDMSRSAVTTSWDGSTVSKTPHLFTLHFIAFKNGKLSETLAINNNPTRAVAFDTNGNPMSIHLTFNKKVSDIFTLEQNYPNAVVTTTTIPFNLPTESDVRLTIYDAQGRILKTINNHFQAGYNEIPLNRADLNATGILHYRLDTPLYSATKKMFVVR